MSQNFVSLTLTPDQVTGARAGLDQMATALAGLVAIPDAERRNLMYMGPRSEVFVRQTLRVMAANPQIVPPSLDLAGASADLATLDQLRPLHEDLQKLVARLADTIDLLGSDAMDVALDGYAQLKLSGGDHGLDELRRQLGTRFKRGRREAAEPAPVPDMAPV
ncbi:hypothetical protein N799_01310 [Lysobacter arseniciresistens ZS79]|uniref:Uncharacterized protein n=1 Tax=Lysobacter arseniciresistens ZS79 TaxID=913325 RepID=A0A0A0F8V7_9GAMM|nr:hypothetical protein [Lysobacter arseniciresistens]KGM57827.1 hypothetical protein N799_01310 [Lysobacter arseniciresistens ZS79]